MNGLTVAVVGVPADDRRHELGDRGRRRLQRRRQSRRHPAQQDHRAEHRLADERADRVDWPRSCRRSPTPTGRVGVGDFNADGKADVILRNKSTGQNIGWLMDGLTVSLAAFLPTIADTNWEIMGAGDFDGDGKADVVCATRSTGQNIGWLMNGLTVSTVRVPPDDCRHELGDQGRGRFQRRRQGRRRPAQQGHGAEHRLADERPDGVDRRLPADDRRHQLGVRRPGAVRSSSAQLPRVQSDPHARTPSDAPAGGRDPREPLPGRLSLRRPPHHREQLLMFVIPAASPLSLFQTPWTISACRRTRATAAAADQRRPWTMAGGGFSTTRAFPPTQFALFLVQLASMLAVFCGSLTGVFAASSRPAASALLATVRGRGGILPPRQP